MNKQNNNFIIKTISLFTLLSLWLGVFAGLPVRAEILPNFLPQNFSETNNLQKDYGKTTLLFEENKGQTDKSVKYFARANGYRLFLTNNEAVFTLKDSD
jgi:hypothetical protein